MAQEGGPNQIGAVSVGVGADLDALRKGFEQAKQEATKAGEEIGEAFHEGIGRGNGGIVGPGLGPTGGGMYGQPPPITPTPADDATGGGGGKGKGATSTATQFNAIVATLSDMVSTFERFAKMGEAVGNLLFENTKNLRDLQLAIEQDVELRHRAQNTQDQVEQRRIAANPLIDIEGLQKKRAQLRDDKDASEKFWEGNTTLATADTVLGSLPITGMMTGDLSSVFKNWGSVISGDFGAMTGPFQRAAMKTNAAREAEAFGISEQLLGVTNRRTGTAGGLLGLENEARGFEPGVIPPIRSLDAVAAAFEQARLAKMNNEELKKWTRFYQESNPERANRLVKQRGN